MAKRKTFDVNALTVMVNEMCRVSECAPDVRQGAMNVLEGVLHQTGNYRGFKYLTKEDVPAGELPGINFDVNGPLADTQERFANTDSTRVYYFF